jgi:hypothetical protein
MHYAGPDHKRTLFRSAYGHLEPFYRLKLSRRSAQSTTITHFMSFAQYNV